MKGLLIVIQPEEGRSSDEREIPSIESLASVKKTDLTCLLVLVWIREVRGWSADSKEREE